MIRNCDCLDGMAELPQGCVDLTVTSPPYGKIRRFEGFTFKPLAIAKALLRITKPGGVCVWVVGDTVEGFGETGEPMRQALGFMSVGWLLHDTMIYRRNAFTKPERLRCGQEWEYMFVFSKGRPKHFYPIGDRKNKTAGKVVQARHIQKRSENGDLVPFFVNGSARITPEYGNRNNIWTYTGGNRNTAPDDLWKKHPAVFPLGLAIDHILTWTEPGENVFDPMCGSGQTCVAAMLLERNWLGFDCSQNYCDIANERMVWYGNKKAPEIIRGLKEEVA